MNNKLRNISLISLGIFAGIAISIQFNFIVQKNIITALPFQELQQLSDVFRLIKSHYVKPIEDKKLFTEAIAGMVSSLDPHSAYLDKQSYKELRDNATGKFIGLGIEISMENGYIKVISLIEDSPAERAGIIPGDLITQLDNTLIKKFTLNEIIRKMHGEEKTQIRLTIVRKNKIKPMLLDLTPQYVRVQSVISRVVEPHYAWLRITQFQEPTVGDMVKKILAIYAQEPNLKGLVLDLRNDPGGVLPAAIGVSAAFLPKNSIIVSTHGQLSNSKANFYAKHEYYAIDSSCDPLIKLPNTIKTVPLVVLVNSSSASASEIVAGALQDYQRAKILGIQTFGKGSVQSVIALPLDNRQTAIKLTTALYYTPKGRLIQAKGIRPDIIVNEYADTNYLSEFHFRETDLINDQNKNINKIKFFSFEEKKRSKLRAKKNKYHSLEFGSKDDFQLLQALNYLKGLPVISSTMTLNS